MTRGGERRRLDQASAPVKHHVMYEAHILRFWGSKLSSCNLIQQLLHCIDRPVNGLSIQDAPSLTWNRHQLHLYY